ncbi:MAG: toxin co-regulated pilus biosynthesis Q family protein [Alphaproteobacteria bacterium]|nr:toxin co-regulated pilus biosynthesis Q family protein [Alphaproteobacteria bacterium]
MFRKFLIFALFATACGYVFASEYAPVWPAPGDEADIQVINVPMDFDPASGVGNEFYSDDADNVRIVSKIGADLVVENNFNMAGRGEGFWSGGADLTQIYQAPPGFNMYEGQAEMPLMHAEMMEDDGGAVLAMSRSDRDRRSARSLDAAGVYAGGRASSGMFIGSSDSGDDFEFEVEDSADLGKAGAAKDQVRSWVVASGQTLRSVLQEWCDKEGWDLVWNTAREYPIAASAVFKGRFMDVSSALVRNFSRADPIPYAKFYKGNRVLVVTTNEE